MEIKEITSQKREANPDEKNAHLYSYYLRNYLITNPLVSFSADESLRNKIYVNFHYMKSISSNLAERIWYTSMIASLGIIPS